MHSSLAVSGIFLAAMTLSGCQKKISVEVAVSHSENASAPPSGIQANFSLTRPTGWTTADGDSIEFTISPDTRFQGQAASSLECRAGLKTLIQSQSFSDCSSGSFKPVPTEGRTLGVSNHNGTYVFEVRGYGSNSQLLGSLSTSFYVNPSLDSIAECSLATSDAQFFEAASQLLDQSKTFGESTSIGPVYSKIEFVRASYLSLSAYDRTKIQDVRELVSLRKKLTLNGDHSLMLLKRVRARSGRAVTDESKCDLRIPTLHQFGADTIVSNDPTPDYVLFERKLRINGLWGATFSGPYRYLDPASYSRVATSGKEFLNAGRSRSAYASKQAWTWYLSETHPELGYGLENRRFACDAVVFNAMGRGVCFRRGTLSDPIPLRQMPSLFLSRFNPDYNESDSTVVSGRHFTGLTLHNIREGRITNLKLWNDGTLPGWEAWLQQTNPSDDDLDYLERHLDLLNP